jgi:hypothetical protein
MPRGMEVMMNPGDEVIFTGRNHAWIKTGTVAEFKYFIGREAIIQIGNTSVAVLPWDIQPLEEPA